MELDGNSNDDAINIFKSISIVLGVIKLFDQLDAE